MNRPGGESTPAGGICAICPHGQIEVIVWKHAVCWDTPPEGESATDPRFEGVKVKIEGLLEKTTGPDGKVLLANLRPATYTVTVEKARYEDVTDSVRPLRGSKVILEHRIEVKEGETSYCDVVLRAKSARLNQDWTWTEGRECLRRHGRPTPEPAPTGTLGPMFWSHEPTWLVARDVLWVACGASLVLAAVIGAIGGSMAALSIAAIGAAFFGYLGGVIFGEGVGTPAIITASALFAVLLAANLLAAAFGFASPDPYGVGTVGGIWAAFSLGYLPGRRGKWQVDDDPSLGMPRPYIWAPALVGAATAGILAALILVAAGEPPGFGSLVFAILGGALFGALSGWTGFAFANEGRTQVGFGASDFKLPYLGERYCLQGARGFWSHHGPEEGAYDWSMPRGTNVLCAKEGHIVAYYDKVQAIAGRGDANYVGVRHRDGSIARYAYFEEDGVTSLSWSRRLGDVLGPLVADWLFSIDSVKPRSSENPVHVRAGHVLGASGLPCEREAAESYGWVLPFGFAFSAIALALVFVPAFTMWKGEPPTTVFTNTAGGVFERLFSAADSNYAYATKLKKVSDLSKGGSPDSAKEIDNLNGLQKKMAGCPVPEKFDQKFCECLTLGPIEQPGNTFSDLGFIAFGLVILGMFAGPDRQPYPNRMTASLGYTLTYGMVVIFMGPGSMLLHISMTASGGLGDGISMYLFGGFLLAYNWVRLQDLCPVWFYLIFFTAVIVATVVNVLMLYSDTLAPLTTLLMVVLIGPALVLQGLVFARSSIKHHGMDHFAVAVGFFVAAFGIWFFSYTDKPLCNPDWPIFSPPSPIQGHAFWHLFAATAIFFMYLHFKNEQEEIPDCPGFPRLHFTVSEAPVPGPSVDEPEPQLRPGQPLPEIRYKPVKFTDGSVASHEARPWSMRKYLSANQNLGVAPLPPDESLFKPKGTGEHEPAVEGFEEEATAPAAPRSAVPPEPPSAPPAQPSIPGGLPPSGPPASLPLPSGPPPSISV